MPKVSAYVKFVFIVCLFSIYGSKVLAADTVPPITSREMDPDSPNGDNGWYVTPIDFTLTASDLDSGVSEIRYRIDGGSWQIFSFENTLNLAPNPSFENYSAGSSIATTDWEKTTSDTSTSYTRDNTTTPTGFESTSIRVGSTSPGWHGINHAGSYATTTPLSNMTAAVWVKTDSIASSAYLKIYSVSLDTNNLPIYTFLGQSTGISGTNNWIKLSHNFVVTDPVSVGIYIDVGFDGTGTAWFDAAEITASLQTRTVEFTVGSDSANHTVEYYSTDRAGNAELYNCSTGLNCVTFKLDQTPPGNWHDSGAFRGLFGSDHELYVYTVVEDATSGLSTFTDKYMYHTDVRPGFGKFSNLLSCSSTWQENQWMLLISPPFLPGVHSSYLLTPKTDFCNNDWKTCKTVRFYAEDLAGNSSSKDFCINGPWVKFRGGGLVRSNHDISMLSEPEEENTDGIVEAGGDLINFFTSTRDWEVMPATKPAEYDYQGLRDIVKTSPTTRTSLTTTSGVYQINSNFVMNNSTVPNAFSSSTFNQIYFIDGDLLITRDVTVASASTALFIVSGKVEIAKSVDLVGIAIMADGDFYTAYNIVDGEGAPTLELNGLYSANKFWFQRTLQGTNNTRYPSEDFTYEPKYLTAMKSYLGTNAILWKSVD
jgi:hypothetical protein